jgi:tetratricopeptide (TPR) repeat protein
MKKACDLVDPHLKEGSGKGAMTVLAEAPSRLAERLEPRPIVDLLTYLSSSLVSRRPSKEVEVSSISDRRNQRLSRSFVGREREVGLYQRWLDCEEPEHNILNIWGVGGVGKTTLLNQLRLLTGTLGIPCAFVDGRIEKDAIGILQSMRTQLASEGETAFRGFDADMRRYAGLRSKLQVAAESMLAGVVSAAREGIPLGLGALVVDTIGEERLEALLRRHVTGQDTEFYMGADRVLTRGFVAGVNALASESKVVLMFDTYEDMEPLDEWVREELIGSRLGIAVLVVISGREPLRGAWHDWDQILKRVELEPLSAAQATTYLRGRGIREAKLMQEVMDFTGRLPLALAMVADVKGLRAGDLTSSHGRFEIIEYLVKRLMRQVEDTAHHRLLEGCAVLRHFDEDNLPFILGESRGRLGRTVLEALLEMHRVNLQELQAAASQVQGSLPSEVTSSVEYETSSIARIERRLADLDSVPGPSVPLRESEVANQLKILRRYSFLRTIPDGFALHDSVRHLLLTDLRLRSPMRYEELHARAVDFYDWRLNELERNEGRFGPRWQKAALDRAYHLLSASGTTVGVTSLQALFKQAEDAFQIQFCEALLNIAEEVPLSREVALWVRYLRGRQAFNQDRLAVARAHYRILWEQPDLTPSLRSHVAEGLSDVYHYQRESRLDLSIEMLENCIQLREQTADRVGTARCLRKLAGAYRVQGRYDEARGLLQKSIQMAEELGRDREAASAIDLVGTIYLIQGDWERALTEYKRALNLAESVGDSQRQAIALEHIARVDRDRGRLTEALRYAEQAFGAFEKSGDRYYMARTLEMQGDILFRQHRWDEAQERYQRSERLHGSLPFGAGGILRKQGLLALARGNLETANQLFLESLRAKEQADDQHGVARAWICLGNLRAAQGEWDEARTHLERALASMEVHGNNHALAGILLDLCDVQYHVQPSSGVDHLAARAERIAQEFGYVEHLARLSALRGKWALHRSVREAVGFYHSSLCYALRYNRFLLDEMVGEAIRECIQLGSAGRQVLSGLATCWEDDRIGGQGCVELERQAREREAGDGKAQASVLAQLGEVSKARSDCED